MERREFLRLAALGLVGGTSMTMARRLLIAAGGSGGFARNAYDDEFNDPSTLTGKWAAHAGGYGYSHGDINSTIAGDLYLQGQVYQIAPPPPYTVESRITYVDWDTGPGVGGIWINLAAAAPGPYFGSGVDVGTPGQMWLSGSTFDSSGAFTGNVGVTGTITGYGYAVPHHCRFVVHSATNVDTAVSFDDGATWTTILSGYNPGFALNYIGLESGGCRTGFDWFRVTF